MTNILIYKCTRIKAKYSASVLKYSGKMNVPQLDSSARMQRSQHWLPLITQQFRLRHLHQIMGMNLTSSKKGKLYFTLHATVMSAPFYTSERVKASNPKWPEINTQILPNSSALAVVLRIWQHLSSHEDDTLLLTWGINFSGLIYVGNRISNLLPQYFKEDSVIFRINGGYFTSYDAVEFNSSIKMPFFSHSSVPKSKMEILNCHFSIAVPNNEVYISYGTEKLRKLHFLQLSLKNRTLDVQYVREKISSQCSILSKPDHKPTNSKIDSINPSERYAPQLLTMNSLYKMLQDKPTKIQQQKILDYNKNAEAARFMNYFLSHELDLKLVSIRHLKQTFFFIREENDEKDSEIMDNYLQLRKECEKLKVSKRAVTEAENVLLYISNQLFHRRKQLLKQLLFIYPITYEEEKYFIHGIHLPDSDTLADCSDTGASIALGYVAHILIMCSILLQIPLRYPIIHFGSRSTIFDYISPLILEKDREFPLFTRSKEKMQFTYAVYLLNKNLAQLRWLFYMHTSDLRATLPNLLHFMTQDDYCVQEDVSTMHDLEKYVEGHEIYSLQRFFLSSVVSDPLIDFVRKENLKKNRSDLRQKQGNKFLRSVGVEGPGLSEILSIPEVFLHEQMSSDVLVKFFDPRKRNSQVILSPGRLKSDDELHYNQKMNEEINSHLQNFKLQKYNVLPNNEIEEETNILTLCRKEAERISEKLN